MTPARGVTTILRLGSLGSHVVHWQDERSDVLSVYSSDAPCGRHGEASVMGGEGICGRHGEASVMGGEGICGRHGWKGHVRTSWGSERHGWRGHMRVSWGERACAGVMGEASVMGGGRHFLQKFDAHPLAGLKNVCVFAALNWYRYDIISSIIFLSGRTHEETP